MCELGLAPKHERTPEFNGMLNYGYHLYAGAFAEMLQEHATTVLGVEHVLANVTRVHTHDDGDIAFLATDIEEDYHGDLFIDCTGFRSLLVGDHYKVPVRSLRDTLFADAAIVTQFDYTSPDAPIASQTMSTAQDGGWIWDIGLQTWRGAGYVYSSAHISEEDAQTRLCDYVRRQNGDNGEPSTRVIRFSPGYRETPWVRNAVAIGLSSGFVEPLEASAIIMVELSASYIADRLPANRAAMRIISDRFNKTFTTRWERIVDFLKLHYCISQRRDTEFWHANTDISTIPDSLKERLELWTYHTPWRDDFDLAREIFPTASYQYVLYGMGFQTRSALAAQQHDQRAAQEIFAQVETQRNQLTQVLPANRVLLNVS